jgi:hypothetical protein
MIRKATLANVLAKVVGERPSLERGIGRSPSYSQRPLMSCSEAEALMRRGSTAKPPSPDSPPRSLAKTSGPWRKLAEKGQRLGDALMFLEGL